MIVSTLVVIIVVAVPILFWKIFNRKRFPPGPLGLPIIGSLHQIGGRSLHEILNEFTTHYGDVFSLQLGTRLVVVLNSRNALNDAFIKKAKQFSARPTIPSHQLSRGRSGIAMTNVTEKYRTSKIMNTRALHSMLSNKKNLDELIMTEVNHIIDLFEQHAAMDQSFFPGDKFKFIIPHLFLTFMFGEQYSYVDPEFLSLVETSDKWFETAEAGDLFDFFDYKVLQFFPRKNLKLMQEYADLEHEFAFKKVKQYLESEQQTSCLLSSYLEHYHRKLDEEKLSEEEVHDLSQVIVDVLNGGFDTVASLLSWAMLYIASYPEVINLCREEISSVLGEKPMSIEYESELPYFSATIYDMLRLSTVGPLGIPHATTEDVRLRHFTIPQGTIVMANLWAINHNPDDWTIPHKLYPEHFLDQHGKINATAVKKLSTFSAGVRRCPGDKLAFYEIFLILGTIIQTYNVKLAEPPVDMLPKRGMSAKPKHFTISLARC